MRIKSLLIVLALFAAAFVIVSALEKSSVESDDSSFKDGAKENSRKFRTDSNAVPSNAATEANPNGDGIPAIKSTKGDGPCVNAVDNLYINGDTTICSGAYSINDTAPTGVLIINSSNLVLDCNGSTIRGDDIGIIYGSGVYTDGFNNVTVKNCNLKRYQFGVYFNHTSNCTITRNNISENNYSGIFIGRSANYNSITENNASNNNQCGLLVFTLANSNNITGNTIRNNGGVSYSGLEITASSDNFIFNNSITGSGWSGVYLHDSSNGTAIKNNRIYANLQDGVAIYDFSSWNNISENMIYGNVVRYGIYLYESNNNTIYRNNISANNNTGILLYTSSNNTVSDNRVTSETRGEGIYLYSDSSFNTIIGNTLEDNYWEGIGLYLSAKNNTIRNNVAWNNYDGLDFWDSASTGNGVFNNIFCNSSDDDIYDADSNFGDNNTCNWTNRWNDSGTTGCSYVCGSCLCSNCSTCNNSLGNASCTPVYLTENIANYAGTCIDNPANFNNRVFDCQDHIIDGDDSGLDYGIKINSKTGDIIKNCILTDFYHGIYFESSSSNNLTNNVANSSMEHGILLYQESNNNTLTNNTANSNNYGIVLMGDSNNNTLTRNTADSNTKTGIYLEDASGNTLNGNYARLNGNRGLDVQGSSGSMNNSIVSNTLSNNTNDGLYFKADSVNNSVSGNTICYNLNYDINNSATITDNFGSGNFCNITSGWNDTVTGLTSCTYYCGQNPEQTFSITLSQGWNLISVPIDMTIAAG